MDIKAIEDTVVPPAKWDNIKELQSTDTDVKKYIFTRGDAIAEAVLYKYGTYEKRTVMCISTQTGCQMGCTFCGTGKFFGRDLTHNEIFSQVQHMIEENNIDHTKVENFQIMVMSMGEPLNNIGAVTTAFEFFHHRYPAARLLVSTSAPSSAKAWDAMMHLAEDIDTVGLQFSVHDSREEERNKLIPMKAKLNLEQIALKGLEFYMRTRRKPFFNYCVTAENGLDSNAHDLRMLFDPRVWEATLSVVCESDESVSDSMKRQLDLTQEFSSKLVSLGYNTRVFDPAGQDDIGGGCGQLWAVQEFARNNPNIMQQSAGNKIHVKQVEA